MRGSSLASVILGLVWVFIIMEVLLLVASIVLLVLGHWTWALVPGLPALTILYLVWWAKR